MLSSYDIYGGEIGDMVLFFTSPNKHMTRINTANHISRLKYPASYIRQRGKEHALVKRRWAIQKYVSLLIL